MIYESYYEENKILCPHPGEKFNLKIFLYLQVQIVYIEYIYVVKNHCPEESETRNDMQAMNYQIM